MSSWERTRYVPWSMVEQTPTAADAIDPDTEKERIFRQLRQEAAKEEATAKAALGEGAEEGSPGTAGQSEMSASPGEAGGGVNAYGAKPTILGMKSAVPYTNMDLFRNFAFGATIGSITGSVFGFMDGMRSAQDSPVLKNASNMAKGRFLMQGATRSGLMFGGIFGGFQSLKYGVRCLADPGDVGEIAVASAVSLGAMAIKPVTRPSIPYAGMLIAMDAFNIYMRDSTA
mmetsp:Transcript_18932/g.44844  ORF Transcript_18932/g.44844 Transcript_18932/m.44844 type:complete len:229 (-) Transcript_18932:11-697(-)